LTHAFCVLKILSLTEEYYTTTKVMEEKLIVENSVIKNNYLLINFILKLSNFVFQHGEPFSSTI
jgi:hypothetical protein